MLAIRWAVDDMALAYSQQLAILLTMLIAGYNMHVKSSWKSVLQLAVLPQLVNLFQ